MPLASTKNDSRKARENRELLPHGSRADLPTCPHQKGYLERFFRAAAAPFFPRAVRTRDGKFAMVLFFLAPAAAFFIFLRAAARCFSVAIFFSLFL